MARSAYAIIIIGFLLLAAVGVMGSLGPIGKGGGAFITVYLAAYALMVLLWFKWPGGARSGLAVLVLAVAARVLMFPFPLGDDINRYVWEGRIQNAGYNPYVLAPDADELAHLRDGLWDGINHKPIAAIYPPGMQVLFRACAVVSDDGRFIRLVFTLFDLATVLLLPSSSSTSRARGTWIPSPSSCSWPRWWRTRPAGTAGPSSSSVSPRRPRSFPCSSCPSSCAAAI